jgi:hypothetical protein
MYYIILFVCVLFLLALAAWFTASQRLTLARASKVAKHDTGQSALAAHESANVAARLFKGERKEDKPCLTPIDCVQANRCAGHCGCR